MLAAGLEMEACYDSWPLAVEAHRRWHPRVPVMQRDVSNIEPEELEGRFVWASLPCQPWSTANRTPKRGKAHPSYYSLAHFARQVQLAEVAVLENVPGLATERDGQAELRELEAECARLGLPWSLHIIPSEWFGVPQIRRRVIIVIGGSMVLFSQPRNFAAVYQRAPTATEGKGSVGRSGRAEYAVTARENRGQGKFKYQPAVRAGRGGGRDKTEYAKSEQVYQGRPPQVCAELQGVPFEPIAGFPKTHQYTLIGNAVPPRFAEGIVRQILMAVHI